MAKSTEFQAVTLIFSPQELAALKFLASKSTESMDAIVSTMVVSEIEKRLAREIKLGMPVPEELKSLAVNF